MPVLVLAAAASLVTTGVFTVIETWQWKERLLVLPDHYIVCFSAMCRDSFHCSLMNYCCVIMVIAYVWRRGAVLK